LAAWPAAGFADEFVNLRFYPGEEPVREDRPSKQSPITLSFVGKVYDPAEARFDSGARRTPDEEFIVRVDRVNREGSKEDILALWEPSERAEIAQDLDDPELFANNRLFYKKVKHSAFAFKAHYGPYIIFLVQNTNELIGEQMQIYPIRRTSNGYVLTNDLADDPMLEFFYHYHRERMQPLEQPEAAPPDEAAPDEAAPEDD
ncbi:MAG: hypothetical protein GY708_08900, partial [Actinomycetia bacterium]|nr:hypothetical protein [Actinomycetes bacterium]